MATTARQHFSAKIRRSARNDFRKMPRARCGHACSACLHFSRIANCYSGHVYGHPKMCYFVLSHLRAAWRRAQSVGSHWLSALTWDTLRVLRHTAVRAQVFLSFAPLGASVMFALHCRPSLTRGAS